MTKGRLLEKLLGEADELIAIFTTIDKKSKQNSAFRLPNSNFIVGGVFEWQKRYHFILMETK